MFAEHAVLVAVVRLVPSVGASATLEQREGGCMGMYSV